MSYLFDNNTVSMSNARSRMGLNIRTLGVKKKQKARDKQIGTSEPIMQGTNSNRQIIYIRTKVKVIKFPYSDPHQWTRTVSQRWQLAGESDVRISYGAMGTGQLFNRYIIRLLHKRITGRWSWSWAPGAISRTCFGCLLLSLRYVTVITFANVK